MGPKNTHQNANKIISEERDLEKGHGREGGQLGSHFIHYTWVLFLCFINRAS